MTKFPPHLTPRILSVEDDLWVVLKPSGVAVHRTSDARIPDLMSWLEMNHGQGFAPIHRLDRPTSGVVLTSPNPSVRAEIGRMFAEHQVNKTYTALALGRTRKKGVIRRELEDQRRGHALEAVTRYRTLELLPGVSLVRVRPETGRKHQIRRHFWGIGHPLVGDQVYRPKRRRKVFAYPGRLWLHATALTLPDGRQFEAKLPAKLDEHLNLLRTEAQRQRAAADGDIGEDGDRRSETSSNS